MRSQAVQQQPQAARVSARPYLAALAAAILLHHPIIKQLSTSCPHMTGTLHR